MSTPTASQSENIGDYLAAGLVTVIGNDGASSPLPAFGPRAAAQMPTNRIEVRAGSFYRASDQMNQNEAGTWFYNHHRGILEFTVITQRPVQKSQGPTTNHGVAIGRTRWLCNITAQKLLPAVIGGYQIVDVIDQGDTYTADEPTDTDRTKVRFQIDLLIPPANYADS